MYPCAPSRDATSQNSSPQCGQQTKVPQDSPAAAGAATSRFRPQHGV